MNRKPLFLSAFAVLTCALPCIRSRADTPNQPSSQKPTLFIIGDSTVKNGQDNGQDKGADGQWGWGHILPFYFDPNKITVENDALGGTSSRSFFENPKLWPTVIQKIHAGDFLLLQFGHNDNTKPPQSDTLRYRSTLPGNGEDTVEGPKSPTENETIHSFGWYIRQYVAQTKEKGATPIVYSLIPRNSWKDGKLNISPYADWAKQAADQGGALFLPLNQLVAETYDGMGQENVTAKFFPPHEATHTNWEGAKLNAMLIVVGISDLDLPLKKSILRNAQAIPAPLASAPHTEP